MTPDLLDLGRQAVKCKRWRWMAGMLTQAGRVNRVESDRYFVDLFGHEAPVLCAGSTPDLSDPATLGCLLALVREAWGDPRGFACPDGFPGVVLQQIDQGSRATYAMLHRWGDSDMAETLIESRS